MVALCTSSHQVYSFIAQDPQSLLRNAIVLLSVKGGFSRVTSHARSENYGTGRRMFLPVRRDNVYMEASRSNVIVYDTPYTFRGVVLFPEETDEHVPGKIIDARHDVIASHIGGDVSNDVRTAGDGGECCIIAFAF